MKNKSGVMEGLMGRLLWIALAIIVGAAVYKIVNGFN